MERTSRCWGRVATSTAPRVRSVSRRAATPSSAYRVGVDGPIPTPPHPAVTAPIVPGTLVVTAYADSKIKTGRTHSFNFSYQRELSTRMMMEAGWVMRLGRELPQAYVLSSVPYFHLDNGSQQTFAQAFDAIATQLRAGVAAGKRDCHSPGSRICSAPGRPRRSRIASEPRSSTAT